MDEGKIIFKSTSPFGADENFTLEFKYNADDGLTVSEMARMCYTFAVAYGFSTEQIKKSFANPWSEEE